MSQLNSSTNPRVHMTTLGCKLNQYDSEMLMTQLRSEGFSETSSARDADLVVVNTCAVTETAERKGRAAVRAALRQNSIARVVATGCMAERSAESLLKAGAQQVFGNREKERVASILANEETVQVGGIRNDEPWTDGTVVDGLSGRVRAFLKIQDGCSQLCTYCIVPKLRGKGRTLPVDEAVRRAEELVDRGFQEIVVTGVALGTYGFDVDQHYALPSVIAALSKVRGLRRLRLGSVEPWAVSERFLHTVAESEVACPHLHLPFQSGCNEVLHRMNRRYTVARLKKMLEYAYKLRDDWGIGADIIVGFPGETEEQFQETKRFIESAPISYLHVFPFSSRPGTAATKLAGYLPRAELAQRANDLRDLSHSLKKSFHQRQIGKRVEVIAENRGSSKFVYGHARNYADVAMPIDCVRTGQIAEFYVERADADFLYCKPIGQTV
ncbi:MAG: tRNA (N(6)-L-threonylcarbamoyladenosine(37)-C(2))-methylthiotransferase MtaB [bacterium]|nr:tRNA (N(6)-L-threonylcarbamoyladenosine(37)-C(2))-methylthiotransferase MtaB [bacterium]